MITLVPLSQLHVSPLNGRKTKPDEDVPWLADDIHERGLNQNLVAVPEPEGLFGPGSLGIVDGGRRYRALMLNVELGRMSIDDPVPVNIRDADDGLALSLSGEIHKVPMNPVDQFAIYAAIVDHHADYADPVAYCAERCGVPEQHVRQRLRLAALAPEILEGLRAGDLSLDAAQAYAGFDDQALQLHVFAAEEARSYGPKHQARNIRDALRSRTYPASIAQAVYVGLENYVAAGGRTDRDLFMGQDEGERLLDPSLLDDIARAKAQSELQQLAHDNGFAEGRLANSFAELPTWPRPERDCTVQPAATWPQTKASRPSGAIGVYRLTSAGAGLELGQWWKPMERSIPPAPPPPDVAARQERLQEALEEIDGRTTSAVQVKQHAKRIQIAAARLVVERSLGAAITDSFSGAACWPVDDEWVPAVSAVAEDQDSVLVAVQIRIPRADWEAAMPDVEQQLEEEANA